MSDVASAGTVIAAVLETAGYVTQAEILASFKSFFSSAGALFYIVGAIGALISVTLFGSYRLARYLIVGPALFWFLVGSTADIGPVVWKLGGSEAESIEDKFSGPTDHYNTDGKVEVSSTFYYYVTVVSDLVNIFVDTVLTHEDDRKLLFIAREKAAELLLNARPQKEELYHMLQASMFGECEPMMKHAMALSNFFVSEGHIRHLEKTIEDAVDQAELDRLEEKLAVVKKTRKDLNDEYLVLAEAQINVPLRMREFIKRQTDLNRQNASEGFNYAQQFSRVGNDHQAFIDQEVPDLILSCGEVWRVNRDAIMLESDWLIQHVSGAVLDRSAIKDPAKRAEAEQKLCRTLGIKLSRDYSMDEQGPCNLIEVVGVFMMRQTIGEFALSRFIKKSKDKMQLMGNIKEIVYLDSFSDKREDRIHEVKPGDKVIWTYSEDGRLMVRDLKQEAALPPNDKKEVWRPALPVDIPGMMEIAFTDQQRYQSRGLMQGIFTYALHLPYWQGTLLYLLSVAFPFLALLVLLPNTARAFLNLPLAWLWVKSWDIGFALVMILDQLLWNLLPRTSVPYNAFRENPEDSIQLPNLLEAALQVDPSYDIHAHLNFIALALYSVPGLTGYAILKAKKSILSSFTDAPQAHSKDASFIGQGKMGVTYMNQRMKGMYELSGVALQMAGFRGQGLTGGGRGGLGAKWGIGAGAADMTGSMLGMIGSFHRGQTQQGGGGPRRPWHGGSAGPAGLPGQQHVTQRRTRRTQDLISETIGAAGRAAERGMNVGYEIVAKEADYAAKYAAAFDPYIGRFGYYQRRLEAAAAGMDGYGGYEVNAWQVSHHVIAADIERFTARVKIVKQIAERDGVAAAGALAKTLFGKPIVEGATKVGTVGGATIGTLSAWDVHGTQIKSPFTDMNNAYTDHLEGNVIEEMMKRDTHGIYLGHKGVERHKEMEKMVNARSKKKPKRAWRSAND